MRNFNDIDYRTIFNSMAGTLLRSIAQIRRLQNELEDNGSNDVKYSLNHLITLIEEDCLTFERIYNACDGTHQENCRLEYLEIMEACSNFETYKRVVL